MGKGRDERLVRPPGALDETDFLARCIRCGECMKVCPNNALQPALTEAGLEGLWTPVLTSRIGYCEPSCVLCSEVCPTGAIWKLTPQEKGWVVGVGQGNAAPVRLGTAFYDRGRCLPWAMATDCIVCQEWCPVSPKAIYLQEVEVTGRERQQEAAEAAARRSQPLRGLRSVRVRLPAAGASGGVCDQHRREPVGGQPDFIDQTKGKGTIVMRKMMRFKVASIAALLTVVVLTGVGCKKKIVDPFPASGAVAGWEKSGKTQSFDAANLCEYIDGGAEQYISAGVVGVSTSDYKFQGSLEATVDVYTMKSADGAKTIFDADPADRRQQERAVGRCGAAVRAERGLPQRTDLVRITAFESAPGESDALMALAHGSRASCRTGCSEQQDGVKGQKHGGAGCKAGVSL